MNAVDPGEIHDYYLGLGSNILPQINIKRALSLLKSKVDVLAVSTAWLTPAVGGEGPAFINAVVHMKCPYLNDQLKETILRPIELTLGRVRSADKNSPRPIDIDILVYDGQVADPRIWQFAHLALPLAELLPDFLNHETGEHLSEIAEQLLNSSDCCLSPCPDIFISDR